MMRTHAFLYAFTLTHGGHTSHTFTAAAAAAAVPSRGHTQSHSFIRVSRARRKGTGTRPRVVYEKCERRAERCIRCAAKDGDDVCLR
uniref:Putative secreted protein n=1 Tax=Anopheles darlingi TaxID=43151 RepID=A0A2M4DPE8_ANODA